MKGCSFVSTVKEISFVGSELLKIIAQEKGAESPIVAPFAAFREMSKLRRGHYRHTLRTGIGTAQMIE